MSASEVIRSIRSEYEVIASKNPMVAGPASACIRLLVISHSCIVAVNQKLYEELARYNDLNVALFFPSRYVSAFDGKTLYPETLHGKRYEIITGPPLFSGNGSLHFYLHGLAQAINSFKPDMVLIDEEPWSLAAFQTLISARRGRSKVLFYTKQNLKKRLPFPFNLIQRLVLRQSSLAFAISEETEAVLRWKRYFGPIVVLPHGVDCSYFRPMDASILRSALGLSDFVFAYFGRLVPEKGVHLFIEAALKLCQEVEKPSFSFLIVGSGVERERLWQMTANSRFAQHFVFHEKVPHADVPRYLNACDVLVLPSLTVPHWKEQFGRIIIEALACEVPVIGSDSGEIPRILTRTGGGLVFREGDSEELARSMALLWRDKSLRKGLASQGRRHVLEHYSLDSLAAFLRERLLEISRSERFQACHS